MAWLDFGGEIQGESTDKTHRGWIDISGFGIQGETGRLTGNGFTLVKKTDRSSPPLFLGCAMGTTYPEATLDLRRTDGSGAQLARMELKGVTVVSQKTTAATPNSGPLETLGLSFREIAYTYFPTAGSPLYSIYDYEANFGSSGTGTPPDPDTDDDGMPDAWETTYNLSIGTNDAAGDADGDGLRNIDELRLGTHPRSGSSFFKASISTIPGSPQTCRVSWNSVIGKTYLVEWSPDLTVPFAQIRSVTATAAESSTDVPRPESLGFFRVRPE